MNISDLTKEVTKWMVLVCATVICVQLFTVLSQGCSAREETNRHYSELNNAAYIECIKSTQRPIECRESVYVSRY